MYKTITFIMLLAMTALTSPCNAQSNLPKDVKHGKEKAYTGDKKPGPLKAIRFTILENDEETTDLDVKNEHGFFEVKYKKGDLLEYKMLDPRRIEMLQDILEHVYQHDDYYQDYTSKKGVEGLEWHLGTQHESAALLINATKVSPKDFGIVNAITSFFDSECEFTLPDTPFPEGKLTYFHYSNKGSMRPGGPEWTVELQSDGRYKVSYMNDAGTKFIDKEPERKEKIFDSKVGDDLVEIFRKGKIQTYKNDYMNPGVTDGSSWRFEARFSEGKSVRSGGYMDGPRDMSGINNALKYVEELLK